MNLVTPLILACLEPDSEGASGQGGIPASVPEVSGIFNTWLCLTSMSLIPMRHHTA